MRLLLALVAAALGGAATAASAEKPQLDLIGFFTGRTHAVSEIKVAFRRPLGHVTHSVGRRAANGDLILVDTIKEEGEPKKERRWVMRRSGPNSFTGSMSEATGPVKITVAGNRATIRYKMKGGISIDQRLTQLNPRTLSNHVSARKLGIRLGRLEGTIRNLD
ncbi:MAG: DUF3833 family protein [Sphingomicrobium sp.]